MTAELERLIRLQQLETAAEQASRRLAEEPDRQRELDDRIAAAKDALTKARAELAENQAARREIEKQLAAVQGRLSKFKDQLMEVKTNREYQAMQKEIETAQRDVAALEDRLLEHMVLSDDVQAIVKRREQELKTEEAEVDTARRELAAEVERTQGELERTAALRRHVVAEIPAALLSVFDTVRQRRGTALSEAQNGLCGICHVRLRPQVYNEVRRNDSIIQCDSCGRILYFVAPSAPQAS